MKLFAHTICIKCIFKAISPIFFQISPPFSAITEKVEFNEASSRCLKERIFSVNLHFFLQLLTQHTFCFVVREPRPPLAKRSKQGGEGLPAPLWPVQQAVAVYSGGSDAAPTEALGQFRLRLRCGAPATWVPFCMAWRVAVWEGLQSFNAHGVFATRIFEREKIRDEPYYLRLSRGGHF